MKNTRVIFLGLITSLAVLAVGISFSETKQSQPGTFNQAQAVQGLNTQQLAYQRQIISEKVTEEGVEAVFDYLEKYIQEDEDATKSCHPLFHWLGHETYHQGDDLQAALEQSRSSCSSGYMHGAILAYFDHEDTYDLKQLCGEVDSNNWGDWHCTHGVGHGLMLLNNYDTAQSVEDCQEFGFDFASNSCINGVFMEYHTLTDHQGNLKPNAEPDFELCTELVPEITVHCYTYLPAAYLEANPNQYEDMFKKCKSVDKEYFGMCLNGLGIQVMEDNVAIPEVALEFCASLSEELHRKACASSGSREMVMHYGSTEQLKRLCDSTFAEYSFKTECSETVSQQQTHWGI